MSTAHPLDTLAVAHEHGRCLRAVAAAERMYTGSTFRRLLARLRRAADRLDPTPGPRLPVSQS